MNKTGKINEKGKEKINCTICNELLNRGNMARHKKHNTKLLY